MKNENCLIELLDTWLKFNSTTDREEKNKCDQYLKNFIKLENLETFNEAILNSKNDFLEFYGSTATTQLITSNYLTIDMNTKINLLNNIQNFMGNFSESDYASKKYVLNAVITLYCRIIRVSFLQDDVYKAFVDDIVNIIKDNNQITYLIPSLIYIELISQFQQSSLPPRNKLKRSIDEFKEKCLVRIYDTAMNSLINIFTQKMIFETTEMTYYCTDLNAKLVVECLDYEEDLNIKEDSYEKYEIRPTFIPTVKKVKVKDRTIDIDFLITFCNKLFEVHNMINKLPLNGSANLNKAQCLILLQKFITMRPIFLGEYRPTIGKCFIIGINELIVNILNKANLAAEEADKKNKKPKRDFNNNETENMEQLCRLIFCLKKNFSFKELLDYSEFIKNVHNLADYLIINFSENLNSLINLMLFFGYFSKFLVSNQIFDKDSILTIIHDVSKKIIERIFYEKVNPISICNNLSVNRSFSNSVFNNSLMDSNEVIGDEFFEADENTLQDFYFAFGDLTTGIVRSVAEFLIKKFEDYKLVFFAKRDPARLKKLNVLVNFTSALLFSNEGIFLEKSLVNKQHENNDTEISDSLVKINPIIYSEFDPKLENEMIFKLISKNFYLIEKIIIMNENNSTSDLNNNNNLNTNNNNNITNNINNNSLISISNKNQNSKTSFIFYSNFKTSPKNFAMCKSKSISKLNSALNSKTSLQYSFCKSEENKDFSKCEFEFPEYLQFSLIKFIKNFSKVFFNRNLILQYNGVFQMITDILKLENSSCLIIFIFRFLIESITKSTNNGASAHKDILLNEIKSIFEIIISKAFICSNFSNTRNCDSNTVNSLFIGKLNLNTDCLLKIMNFHLELNFMDPVAHEKLRKLFYNSLTRLLILNSNASSNNEDDDASANLFFQLVDHYVFQISENAEKLKISEQMQSASVVLLGLMIDSIGILQTIDTRSHYNYFVRKYVTVFDCLINFYFVYRNVPQLQIVVLKFFFNITKNSCSRIDFHGRLVYIPKLLIDKIKLLTEILHTNLNEEISAKNPLTENERYNKIIKPISLIFRIYENMITGNYLQFYSIISMDLNYAQDIVAKLMDLSFVLCIEEIDSYKNKFNSLFNTIYYLFSDLHVFIKSENQLANLDKFFLLAYDGIDSCNLCFSLISFKIVFYFCKNFIELRQSYQNSGNNPEALKQLKSSNNYFVFVFDNFSSKFILFLEKMLKMLMQGIIGNVTEMSQALLGLIVLFWDDYYNSASGLVEKMSENEEKKKLFSLALEDLMNRIEANLSHKNVQNFQKNFGSFKEKINEICG